MSLLRAIAVTALVVVAPSAAAEERAEKPNGELVARIAALGEAYRSGDVDALEDLIADNYSHINNGAAPISRKVWLDANRERAKRITAGSLKVIDYQMSDLRVTLLGGETAVVTGQVRGVEESDGSPREYNVRFTNVWVKADGEWKRAAFHDSPVRQ